MEESHPANFTRRDAIMYAILSVIALELTERNGQPGESVKGGSPKCP